MMENQSKEMDMIQEVLKIINMRGEEGIGWYGMERVLILRDSIIPKEGNILAIYDYLLEAKLIEARKTDKSIHPYFYITEKGKRYLDDLN